MSETHQQGEKANLIVDQVGMFAPSCEPVATGQSRILEQDPQWG